MSNCNNLAVSWGWGGFYIVNLCAFMATIPADARPYMNQPDPANDAAIQNVARQVSVIVLAWGNGNEVRARQVLALLGGHTLHCIDHNIGGAPLHPVRVHKYHDYPGPIIF